MKTSKSISRPHHVLLVFKVGFFVYMFTRIYRKTELREHPIALLPVILLCLGVMSYILSGLTWREAGVVPWLRRSALGFIALSLVLAMGFIFMA
jgi:hypothetical protein